jgi:hypothetical protein
MPKNAMVAGCALWYARTPFLKWKTGERSSAARISVWNAAPVLKIVNQEQSP